MDTSNLIQYLPFLLIAYIVLKQLMTPKVSPANLQQSLKDGSFDGIILDVRSPGEVLQTGKIKGALTKNLFDPDFNEFIKGLDQSKKCIVYCKSGMRSARAVSLLKKQKLEAYNLSGGIMRWKILNLPLEKV